MNVRRPVPPAFYGIYNDNDNNQNPELKSDDLEALRSALVFLIEKVETEGQQRFNELEARSEAIFSAYKKTTAEIDAAITEEFRVAQQDFERFWEARRWRRDIDKKTEDVSDRLNQELETAIRQVNEEQVQLLRKLENEQHRISKGIRVVCSAYGLEGFFEE
jgi:hypothetical protein